MFNVIVGHDIVAIYSCNSSYNIACIMAWIWLVKDLWLYQCNWLPGLCFGPTCNVLNTGCTIQAHSWLYVVLCLLILNMQYSVIILYLLICTWPLSKTVMPQLSLSKLWQQWLDVTEMNLYETDWAHAVSLLTLLKHQLDMVLVIVLTFYSWQYKGCVFNVTCRCTYTHMQ